MCQSNLTFPALGADQEEIQHFHALRSGGAGQSRTSTTSEKVSNSIPHFHTGKVHPKIGTLSGSKRIESGLFPLIYLLPQEPSVIKPVVYMSVVCSHGFVASARNLFIRERAESSCYLVPFLTMTTSFAQARRAQSLGHCHSNYMQALSR